VTVPVMPSGVEHLRNAVGHRSNFAFDTHEMTSHFRRTHFHLRDFASEIAVSPHAVRIGRYQAFCAAAA
jgi:hypothetical protein